MTFPYPYVGRDPKHPVHQLRLQAIDLRLRSDTVGLCRRSPVVSAELSGGQHSFDLFHSIRFESLLDGIEAFAAWVGSTKAHRIAVDRSRVNR